MNELYDMPNGLWFKGQFIKEGDGLYLGTSDEFFRGGLDGISRCLKANGQDAGVCVRLENIKTMKERGFHKQVRVVYRAMRRLYGVEKVQDECLRVFKVLFPIYLRAKNGEDVKFTEKDIERIGKIFRSWNIQHGSEVDFLLGKVVQAMEDNPEQGVEQFCDDCMPVVMRIRKLTNRECYRLQGVSEKDIDTLLSCGISKSAHYKLAGNSITAGGNFCNSEGNWDGPLFNLFRKMFVETEPDMVKGEAVQLCLF